MKFFCFNLSEWREEERRVSRDNWEQHAEYVTEDVFANGKRHKEGKEFANSPNFVFRFYFILFYFYIFISNVSKYMASRSNQKCLTTIHAVLYIRMIFIINL